MYSNTNVESAVTAATGLITGDGMLAVGTVGAAVMGIVVLIGIFRWVKRAF